MGKQDPGGVGPPLHTQCLSQGTHSPLERELSCGKAGTCRPNTQKGDALPSLSHASTHKALMFSVTTEVYCGSVCGEIKCPP